LAVSATALTASSPAGAVGETTTSTTTPPARKVFVCKYVGTPGVDERLQTGNNPISVSINAIPDPEGDGVHVGDQFPDAHGRSVVIAFDTGQPEPDVSQCPQPVVATTTTTTPAATTTTPAATTTTTTGTTATTGPTTTAMAQPTSSTQPRRPTTPSTLPSTGSTSTPIAIAGLVAALGGMLLLTLSRRRA
jgi:LPXTG-motif cell wall-anchored protein